MKSTFFDWFKSSYVSYLLYVMLFFVGMNLIQRSVSFKTVLRDPSVFLLPVYTIAGTLLGRSERALRPPSPFGKPPECSAGSDGIRSRESSSVIWDFLFWAQYLFSPT